MPYSIAEISKPSILTFPAEEPKLNLTSLRAWGLFAALGLAYVALSWLTNRTFLTEDVYYNTFSEQLSLQQIETFFTLQNRYAFLGYALIFPSLLLKITYTTVWLAIAAVLADWDFSFGAMFKAALVAELVFLVGAVIHFVWCLLFLDVVVLTDLAGFYPLSLLNFFDLAELEPWLIYPLRTLNLFEVAYCVVLIHLLRNRLQRRFKATAGLVFGAYGVGLLIWVLLAMFVSLLLS